MKGAPPLVCPNRSTPCTLISRARSRVVRGSVIKGSVISACLLLGLLVGVTSAASAAPPTPTPDATNPAEAEYNAGKEALKSSDFAEALRRFKQGLTLAQDDERTAWQMMLGIAVTYQRMDRPAFAIEYYKRFLKRSDAYQDALTGKWSNRRSMAERDIEALETTTKTTHGFLTVVSEPPGAAIFLGADQAGADKDATTTFGMYVRAGRYDVTLRLAGYEPATRQVEVAEGKLVALKVRLSSLTPSVTPKETAAAPAATSTSAALSTEVTLGPEPNLGPWIVVGTGGTVAIASVVLGVVAMGARSDWETFTTDYQATGDSDAIQAGSDTYDDLKQTTEGYELAMGVTAGVAVAAMAGGLIWWLVDSPSEDAPDTASFPALYLAPSPDGVSGYATWRF
jgi:tetratricopeptide (TPR) repeat protein